MEYFWIIAIPVALLALLLRAVVSFLFSPGEVYLPEIAPKTNTDWPAQSSEEGRRAYEQESRYLSEELGVMPAPGEEHLAFLRRMTQEVVLTPTEEQQAKNRVSAYERKFASDQENSDYYKLTVLVEKRIKEFRHQKELERKNLWSRKIAEENRVRLQIQQGLPIEYDASLLSENWVEQVKAKVQKENLDQEAERIRSLFFQDLDSETASAILSKEEIEAIWQEVFATLREAELGRLRGLIESGITPQGDRRLVSLQDFIDLKIEFEDVRNVWLRNRRRPAPQPYGVNPQGAEQLVADWLEYLGCKSVEVTQASQDDGVDVFADDYVCQVKYFGTQPVSVNEVREIYGVAAMLGKKAILFTSTALTASAAKFAEVVGLPAIRFIVETSELSPLNEQGKKLLSDGMYDNPR